MLAIVFLVELVDFIRRHRKCGGRILIVLCNCAEPIFYVLANFPWKGERMKAGGGQKLGMVVIRDLRRLFAP